MESVVCASESDKAPPFFFLFHLYAVYFNSRMKNVVDLLMTER